MGRPFVALCTVSTHVHLWRRRRDLEVFFTLLLVPQGWAVLPEGQLADLGFKESFLLCLVGLQRRELVLPPSDSTCHRYTDSVSVNRLPGWRIVDALRWDPPAYQTILRSSSHGARMDFLCMHCICCHLFWCSLKKETTTAIPRAMF